MTKKKNPDEWQGFVEFREIKKMLRETLRRLKEVEAKVDAISVASAEAEAVLEVANRNFEETQGFSNVSNQAAKEMQKLLDQFRTYGATPEPLHPAVGGWVGTNGVRADQAASNVYGVASNREYIVEKSAGFHGVRYIGVNNDTVEEEGLAKRFPSLQDATDVVDKYNTVFGGSARVIAVANPNTVNYQGREFAVVSESTSGIEAVPINVLDGNTLPWHPSTAVSCSNTKCDPSACKSKKCQANEINMIPVSLNVQGVTFTNEQVEEIKKIAASTPASMYTGWDKKD